MIEETTGGVTVVPRSGQADYIKFVYDADGCSSPIGRQGGEQQIKMADDCSAGNMAHEMMHSLGMFHEQSRCDRDDFVEILFDNVESGKENNFDKECDGATDLGDNYDFGSMMHYSLTSFSSNGQPTIRLRPGVTTTETIGQRSALSVLDRFTINYLYGLNNIPPVPRIAPFAASYDEGSGVPMDATGSTDADDKKLTYRWNFGDDSCFAFPEPADCTQAKPSHVYANDGVYKVGLFVWDGYEEEATEQYVTIKNVKPVVDWTTGFFALKDEGEAWTQGGDFTDPGADYWSASVDYGDGSASQALTLVGKSYVLGHTYADNGTFTVTVSVTDDDETGTQSKSVQVRNVVPNVDAGADKTFTSGERFNFAGSFSDPGVNDSPWAWSIDWGTGTPTTGSATTQGAITASNRVCSAGTYTVTLSVTDKDNGKGTDAAQVTVGYLAVGISIQPGSNPSPIALKKQGTFPVAILSTATFDARTIDVASLRIGNEVGAEAGVATLKGKYQTTIQDVNGDGRLDMMAQFSVQDLVANGDLTMGTTSLALRGKLGVNGDPCINFRGVGAVKTN
jgi:PKD repeat protein